MFPQRSFFGCTTSNPSSNRNRCGQDQCFDIRQISRTSRRRTAPRHKNWPIAATAAKTRERRGTHRAAACSRERCAPCRKTAAFTLSRFPKSRPGWTRLGSSQESLEGVALTADPSGIIPPCLLGTLKPLSEYNYMSFAPLRVLECAGAGALLHLHGPSACADHSNLRSQLRPALH